MDDLASVISQFVNSEEGMAQLQQVASALGMDIGAADTAAPTAGGYAPPSSSPPQGLPDLGGLGSLLGSLDMNTIMMLQRAAGTFKQEDKNTELLRALKPHFSPERAKRVDDAVRIIQLIRLLPLVKEMGILEKLKGGERK